MNIAYFIFDGITLLDFIGVYDPLSRLRSMKFIPDLTWDICSYTEEVRDSFGLTITPDKVRPSLADYDVIVVHGGFGTRALCTDPKFIDWFRTAEPVSMKVSVCTGSLLLGVAGFLKDLKATTNFLEYETLRPYCREVSRDRIVHDGNVITAGAVSASIDLGLYLCKLWCGDEKMEQIKERMAYGLPGGDRSL